MEPVEMEDEYGEVKASGIHTYGETIHLSERKNYTPVPLCRIYPTANPSTGLLYVDHCVGNVGWKPNEQRCLWM